MLTRLTIKLRLGLRLQQRCCVARTRDQPLYTPAHHDDPSKFCNHEQQTFSVARGATEFEAASVPSWNTPEQRPSLHVQLPPDLLGIKVCHVQLWRGTACGGGLSGIRAACRQRVIEECLQEAASVR